MGRAMMFDGTRSGEAREGALQGKRVSEWLFETRPQFVSIIPNLAAAAAARSSCHRWLIKRARGSKHGTYK
jgi:hypothetical protein